MDVRISGLAAAGLALAVDQATKAAILANADTLAGGWDVFPGFALVVGRNDGVAFGLLGGTGPWTLVMLAALILGWLGFALLQAPRRREAMAYGAIIGGALGNVIDRLRYGAVTDFLDLYVGRWHWPAFNFADIAVVCGAAAIILFDWYASQQRKARNSNP
ncbi:MAG: signal peptidase II [Jannaschia sp.]